MRCETNQDNPKRSVRHSQRARVSALHDSNASQDSDMSHGQGLKYACHELDK